MLKTTRLASCLFLFILAVAVVPRVSAWGMDEHCAAGEIASRHLTPVAKAEVTRLLYSAPDSHYETLALASRWPDDIKGNPDYKWSRPWHYINLPPGAASFDPARDHHPDGDVMQGIARFSKELADTSLTTETRRQALMFLAHFVEDVHQPLHTGHVEDRGGNNIKISFRGKPGNLHGMWDYMLTEALRPEWPEYAEQLNSKITPEQKAKWLATMDPVNWVNSSYRLSEDFAYKVPADGVIDEAYAEKAIAIIDERIAESGFHLAMLLNTLLDKSFVLPASADAATTATSNNTPTTIGQEMTIISENQPH